MVAWSSPTEANVSASCIVWKNKASEHSKSKKDSASRCNTHEQSARHYEQAENTAQKQQTQFLKMLNAGEADILEQAAQKLPETSLFK